MPSPDTVHSPPSLLVISDNSSLATYLHIAIEPAAVEVQLLLFALANCYQGAPPHVPFTIGIDASVWFKQCQQQMWYHHILDAFHILWLMAPAEVEAHMNKTAIVDAVMTDDSDVFVFGTHTVLQNSSLMDGNSIKVYTTDAIRQQVNSYLHDEAFAIMTLCYGGDYDEVPNLHGCGITTALGLVQCGVGDQL
ncbi:hypothetical protein HD554DRAFT_2034303 [Boletus coccyginus]|nr:hypothetical protein HD554DRAFT_2034303 [Boletus coccyginus]